LKGNEVITVALSPFLPILEVAGMADIGNGLIRLSAGDDSWLQKAV
jgi:hypothetical protein